MSPANYTQPSFAVETEADVVYATVQGYWSHAPVDDFSLALNLNRRTKVLRDLELQMDIYTPQGDTSATRPLLLMMHGGAYLFGNKNEAGQSGWCRHFASLGYVAASIDYRLGFRLRRDSFAQAERWALEDATLALGYLLGREDLRIDPQRVVVAGTSAGAAIALCLAFDPPAGMPPCRIRAVGDFWGYVHDLSILEQAAVPVLAFQSEKDPVVPYRQGFPPKGRALMGGPVYGTFTQSRKAEELGHPFELYPCPERRHRLHLDKKGVLTPRFYEMQEKMTEFFANALPI